MDWPVQRQQVRWETRIQIPGKEHKPSRTDAHTDGGVGDSQQAKYPKGSGFLGHNKVTEHDIRERSNGIEA